MDDITVESLKKKLRSQLYVIHDELEDRKKLTVERSELIRKLDHKLSKANTQESLDKVDEEIHNFADSTASDIFED